MSNFDNTIDEVLILLAKALAGSGKDSVRAAVVKDDGEEGIASVAEEASEYSSGDEYFLKGYGEEDSLCLSDDGAPDDVGAGVSDDVGVVASNDARSMKELLESLGGEDGDVLFEGLKQGGKDPYGAIFDPVIEAIDGCKEAVDKKLKITLDLLLTEDLLNWVWSQFMMCKKIL